MHKGYLWLLLVVFICAYDCPAYALSAYGYVGLCIKASNSSNKNKVYQLTTTKKSQCIVDDDVIRTLGVTVPPGKAGLFCTHPFKIQAVLSAHFCGLRSSYLGIKFTRADKSSKSGSIRFYAPPQFNDLKLQDMGDFLHLCKSRKKECDQREVTFHNGDTVYIWYTDHQ